MKRIAFLVLMFIAILVLAYFWLQSRGIAQPVQFNHQLHTKKVGLSCEDCHVYFKTQRFSGLPSIEVCAGCHSEAQGKSREEAKVVNAVKEGKTIEWNRIYEAKRSVIYSHRLHVVVGKLECKVCHGDIADTVKPPRKPLVDISMDRCRDCHRKMKVSVDCITCHM